MNVDVMLCRSWKLIALIGNIKPKNYSISGWRKVAETVTVSLSRLPAQVSAISLMDFLTTSLPRTRQHEGAVSSFFSLMYKLYKRGTRSHSCRK